MYMRCVNSSRPQSSCFVGPLAVRWRGAFYYKSREGEGALVTLSAMFAPVYDIFPGDYRHHIFPASLGNLPPTGGVHAPVFPTYDDLFPTPTSFISAPSLQPSGSLQPTSTVSYDAAPFGNLLSPESNDARPTAKSLGKRKRSESPRPRIRRLRKRRCPGTGYADVMAGLPIAIQNALMQEYPDCCTAVKKRDDSALMKHRFSRAHHEMVPADLQPQLPAFTCPAFIALHPECPSAKHGRYDSSERHCEGCPGFKEIRGHALVFPIGITRQEFESILKFRKAAKPLNPDGEAVFSSHVQDAVFKFLDMFLKGMRPQSVSPSSNVTSDRQHSFVFDDEGVEGDGDNGDLSGHEYS
ncbi:hypothetical protein BC826DRAFT_1189743 [Russula brevipes]|nr:hypothetical protein BC826DRAFT_1189743 [Russula brevipes]